MDVKALCSLLVCLTFFAPKCLTFHAWTHTEADHNSRNLSREFKAAFIPGQIILGGLFPVHEKGGGGITCGTINEDRGIQRLEAMLFTIDEINRSSKVLPNITLGVRIFDTCSRDTYALEQSLDYVRASMSNLESDDFVCLDDSKAVAKSLPLPVAGVVGGSYSSVSIQVANLLRLFKIPQISYASTTAALSDKSRFDLFARTVPPDTFQAKAIVDIVTFLNWTYVSTVASAGDYGENGIDTFTKEARYRNICIAADEKIPFNSTRKHFDDIIEALKLKENARGVVLFTRMEDARSLLRAATRKNVTNQFVWIAADGWGREETPVKENNLAAEGAITLDLQTAYLTAFDSYFRNLTPAENMRNPWFKEYWEKIHKCSFDEDSKRRACTGNEKLSATTYKQESKLQFVYDAVYALAYAVQDVLVEGCPGENGVCFNSSRLDGNAIYRRLLNVSFTDTYGGQVEFNQQGDGLGRYNIFNYQKNKQTGRYDYEIVGEWWNDRLNLNVSHMVWAGGVKKMPESVCSRPCKHGEIKQGESCCWVCTACQPWEYVKDEHTCAECGEGSWPNPDMQSCYRLPEQYVKWDSVYAIIPVCLANIGIICTSCVILIFIKHNETPVVKASGKELSFLLLIGCLVCYFMTFTLLSKPSTFVCAFQRFGVGFGFSIMYASLLTKTNRIARIFENANRTAKRPVFISPKSQLVISAIFISIQVVIACIWLLVSPPGTRYYFPNEQRDQMVLKCAADDVSFLLSLAYNMVLIITCTVYAVKTRKIPENFNESKFIGFTMYTTCIIWLAFIPIYFGTLNSFQIQTTTLCISISLSATVALTCLFAPKVYIIIMQPQKNVRKSNMMSVKYQRERSIHSSFTHNGSSTDRGEKNRCLKMTAVIDTACVDDTYSTQPV